MKRILVTGSTGSLGRRFIPLAMKAGYTLRVMSRQARPDDVLPQVEWAQADLSTGRGLREAVAEVQIILHAATNPFFQTKQVDVEGTRQLLGYARAAGVEHVIYPSIVGLEHIPLNYYRHKLAAEAIVKASGIPWSIVRATPFHSQLDRFLRMAARLPLMFLPLDYRFQGIDAGEVAAFLLSCTVVGPAGRWPDMGGPEISNLEDLARIWLKARGLQRDLVHLPMPGALGQALRQGQQTTPAKPTGHITWSMWLWKRYAHETRPSLANPSSTPTPTL